MRERNKRRRRSCNLVTIAVFAASTFGAAYISDTAQNSVAGAATNSAANPFRIGRTLVIPHSGGDGLFPENTLYAYERSSAMGGDVVDIDVSLSSDGVLVAFHDSLLRRTTGAPGRVSTTSFAELSKLDAGWGFTRSGTYPFRGRSLTVPSVEAILRRFPTTLVTLDLKDQRTLVAKPVCELLLRLGRTGDVYVGSDSSEQVLAIRRTCPSVRTSGTDTERRAARAARESGDLTFRSKQLVSQPRFKADDGTRRVTPETLAFSHRMGTAVLTWIVDDPKDMAELIDLGVDGIYTRRPDLLVEVLRNRRAR